MMENDRFPFVGIHLSFLTILPCCQNEITEVACNELNIKTF